MHTQAHHNPHLNSTYISSRTHHGGYSWLNLGDVGGVGIRLRGLGYGSLLLGQEDDEERRVGRRVRGPPSPNNPLASTVYPMLRFVWVMVDIVVIMWAVDWV